MTKSNPSDSGKPNLRPEAQTDESHGGAIKSRQVTNRNASEDDLPRGAEAGHGRGGGGA